MLRVWPDTGRGRVSNSTKNVGFHERYFTVKQLSINITQATEKLVLDSNPVNKNYSLYKTNSQKFTISVFCGTYYLFPAAPKKAVVGNTETSAFVIFVYSQKNDTCFTVITLLVCSTLPRLME